MKTVPAALFAAALLFAGSAVHADEYLAKFKSIAARGAAMSKEKYWQGEHFGETPFKPEDKLFAGRNSHDFTMSYWNFMDAKLNGNLESSARALSHYNFSVKRFWSDQKNLFNSDYDFLMNTSIALTLSLSLRDARDVIPAETQADMQKRLAGIAKYLPTYNTSHSRKDGSLRAINQDAFATLALALIAIELKDDAIRRDALVKFRQVMACTRQSFWVEGGVDVGYQSVGEPAFAAAADLLWDDLSFAEKKKVADLGLNNIIGNGYGLENARSSSWLRQISGRAFASAILNRTPNSRIAADAEALINETAEKGFKSKWWLHDPASLSFYTGFYFRRAAIEKIAKQPRLFGCGSLASQIMERDEAGGWYCGMEKGYLTGDLGTTAMFGDYSRFNPAQTKPKFGAERAPFTESRGNLRYLGLNSHLYIFPDDTLGCPRLNSADLTRAPQTINRVLYPGAGASVYCLDQVMPGLNGSRPLFVNQSFAVLGDVLVAVFAAPQPLDTLSFDFTLPFYKLEEVGGTFKAWQNSMTDNKSRHLAITPFRGKIIQDKNTWTPYFKNEVDLDGKKIKFPKLRRLQFAFDSENTAALILAPEGRARNVKFEKLENGLAITFTTGKRQYTVVQATAKIGSIEYNGLTVTDPQPGFPQMAAVEDNAVVAFAGYAAALKFRDAEFFRAEAPAHVSGLRRPDGLLADVGGEATVLSGKSAVSWVDGRTLTLPAKVAGDRILIRD